jgi:antitoxin ParD1/3/4
MSSLTISLSESMKEFVDSQVSAGGFDSPSAYVRGLIERAQVEKNRAEIDTKLLEGVDALERGEGREMQAADWEKLRALVRSRQGKGNGR